jgi:lysophospholipase L1-like esterase
MLWGSGRGAVNRLVESGVIDALGPNPVALESRSGEIRDGGTRMFGRIGRRTRVALVTLGLVVASALGLSAGSAPVAAVGSGPGYLALGDSVAFGYITQAGFEYGNANNFVGYPAYAGADLKLNTVNASCPGEATTGFISATGADNGCRLFRTLAPLHVSYSGTQLAFATSFLAAHPETRLVTIALGANDLFILQNACATSPTPTLCIQTGLATLLPEISANMDTILKAIRAHFHGLLVVVNYYSLDYTDLAGTGVTELLNQAETAPAHADGAVVANAFTAFQTAASTTFAGGQTCKAGLLNAFPGSQFTCDVHPSQSGQQLLASTVEQVVEAHSP